MKASTKDTIQFWGVAILILLFIVWAVVGIKNLAQSQPTTYCSEYVKVVKIEPIYEDDGKYEDELLRVTYEDGTIASVDEGKVGSYKCVKQVEVDESQRKDGWKVVDSFGEVDWEG